MTDLTPAQRRNLTRPRDSATLIIIDSRERPMRVLMGKRSAGHVFMPGKFVFPGGRVDRADARVRPASELRAEVSELLQRQMRGHASAGRARGLAMAAVRETFEETGLLVGEKISAGPATRAPSWRAFFQAGVRPALDRFHFIARAITPPGRTRRFDSRFFACDASQIAGDASPDQTLPEELLDISWMSFDDVHDLDLPNITRTVLHTLRERLNADGEIAPAPVPFWYMDRDRFRRDTL